MTTPHKTTYQVTINFNSALFKVLLKCLQPSKGERILDLGCGRGFYVKEMENYTEGVIGVDISKNSLEEAVTQKVKYGDATDLNFEANSLDKIYSLHTIEHIPNLKQLFSEVARVLKPGGIAIVIYPWELIRGIQAIAGALRQYKNPLMARKMHLHRLTPQRIEELISGTSLSHVESKFIFALSFQYLTILKKYKIGC